MVISSSKILGRGYIYIWTSQTIILFKYWLIQCPTILQTKKFSGVDCGVLSERLLEWVTRTLVDVSGSVSVLFCTPYFFRRFVLIFKFVGNSNYQTTTLNGLGKGLDAYMLWCLVNLSTLPGVWLSEIHCYLYKSLNQFQCSTSWPFLVLGRFHSNISEGQFLLCFVLWPKVTPGTLWCLSVN